MSTHHRDLTDPHIHEPKGITDALADQFYVANGANSGAWTHLQNVTVPPCCGSLFSMGNNTNTTLTNQNDWYALANVFTSYGLYNMTAGSGTLTTSLNGIYKVEIQCDISHNDGAAQVLQLAFDIDSDLGVVTPPPRYASVSVPTGTLLTQVTFSSLHLLAAGKVIRPMIRNITSAGKTPLVAQCSMQVQLMRKMNA